LSQDRGRSIRRPPSLTAAVLARDESTKIERCLAALTWADERLVLVDAATRDDTVDRAAALGARVATRPFSSFAEQRNAALDLAETEWVLFVDADELVTPELAAEVREVLEKTGQQGAKSASSPLHPVAPSPVGFWIPRHNLICGRWIRHAGWYPDVQLRLLRRGRARYDEDRPVHELVVLDGPAGRLAEPLIHYNYATLGEFRRKQASYSELEAQALYRRGVRPRVRNFILQPLREFWRRYVRLRGCKEGLLGLQLATLLGWSTFLTYWKLARLWRRS
jgi:glycosyltransferase involved in cell wall biosynthesis